MTETILDVSDPKHQAVFKASDPAISNVATPGDFAAQFPTPLDPTEILALCEEISALQVIPEYRTGLKTYSWREMDRLDMTSGSMNYSTFADGACPEEYIHEGDNKSIDLKNIGVKKSLTISDIMHSAASIQIGGAISALLGPGAATSGMPGGTDATTFLRQTIADLKEKELILGTTLVMNEWDELLVKGDVDNHPLEFDGIEEFGFTNFSSGTFTGSSTGTFTATDFDQFLASMCAKPTHIFGHPTAIQAMMLGYFSLGFQGSQIINVSSGDRMIPGFNFASFVNTAVGRLQVVADTNFTRTTLTGTSFEASLYALRMTHNGEPLVFRETQIPLGVRDLAPGCTAISFEIWVKTALIIKNLCMHGKYTSIFGGRTASNACTAIG